QHRSVLSGDIDNDDTTDNHGIVTDPVGNRYGNSYHVVLLDGGTAAGPVTASTVLDGLVITSGKANGNSSDRLNMGGGLFCRANNTGQHCSPTLRDVLFSGNTGVYGAAVALLGTQGGTSSPQFFRVHFSANQATSYGGGMYLEGRNAGSVNPLLREVRFTGNRANNYGGALYNDARGGTVNPVIEQTQFSGNNASYGGALYNNGTGAGNARASLVNVTFQGNSAQSEGGAIYNEASTSGDTRMQIRHVTFHGNSASRGGAIADTGSSALAGVVMHGVILWGNSGHQGPAEVFTASAQPSISASVVAGGCPASVTCSNIITGNPLLGGLTDNGGWSWTMQPGTGSSAIDAISHAGCPALDQRGVPRAQGSLCDIGAVEVTVPACHVNIAASGSNNGSNWANAYTSLQSALTSPTCGEIRVARGIYKPTSGNDQMARFHIRPGQRVYGGFAGHELQLEQRDPAANRTVLSGDIDNNDITDPDGILVTTADRRGNNSHRLVELDGSTAAGPITATTVLDGFAITGAYGEPLGTAGGGLYCRGTGAGSECSPTLANLLISANYDDFGGGMYNAGSNGGNASPTLVNVTFRNNGANYGAGGMHNDGSNGGRANATLINVTFVGNLFKAMYNDGDAGGDASPTLNHVTFANNRDRFEGASMINFGRNGNAHPVLVNVIAWGGTLNFPEEGKCGNDEICNYFNAHPVIEASVIAGGCPPGSLCGAGVTSADPLLAALADNGGVGPTLIPGIDGSAVDAGDDATCAEFDQRGVSRPQRLRCDIGAVEVADLAGDRIFSNGFELP
ncbi:MAG: choice-of-anchor Q domain-containing protein, partial [Lysobacterales bacterium]